MMEDDEEQLTEQFRHMKEAEEADPEDAEEIDEETLEMLEEVINGNGE